MSPDTEHEKAGSGARTNILSLKITWEPIAFLICILNQIQKQEITKTELYAHYFSYKENET